MTIIPLKNIEIQLMDWIEIARASGIHAYLLLDGSWQANLIQKVRQIENGWEPLIGEVGEHKQSSHSKSPLIVDLENQQQIIHEWLLDGFDKRLGFVAFSRLDIQSLRTKLKKFVSVILPEGGKPAFLRFYDARILHCFLQSGFAEQWLDFMEGIELIAAPSDFSSGWTTYRISGDILQYGIASIEAEKIDWHKLKPSITDSAYKAAFPFRRIDQPQYEAMISCGERAFSIEISQFLLDCFPDETEAIQSSELLHFVTRARNDGVLLGYDTEDAQFYFAVLAFMGGFDFYLEPKTSNFLEKSSLDPTSKLEKLLQNTSLRLKNQKLADLVDRTEIEISYSDGSMKRFRQFSGAIVE